MLLPAVINASHLVCFVFISSYAFMCSRPSLQQLSQATLGSTFERQLVVPSTAKIAKCESTYLYYDRPAWNMEQR